MNISLGELELISEALSHTALFSKDISKATSDETFSEHWGNKSKGMIALKQKINEVIRLQKLADESRKSIEELKSWGVQS